MGTTATFIQTLARAHRSHATSARNQFPTKLKAFKAQLRSVRASSYEILYNNNNNNVQQTNTGRGVGSPSRRLAADPALPPSWPRIATPPCLVVQLGLGHGTRQVVARAEGEALLEPRDVRSLPPVPRGAWLGLGTAWAWAWAWIWAWVWAWAWAWA